MLLSKQMRRGLQISAGVSAVALVFAAMTFADEQEKAPVQAGRQAREFIRAVEADEEADADIGVHTVVFDIRPPKGHSALVRFVVRNERGVEPALPAIAATVWTKNADGHCLVRLVRLDPQRAIETYDGKIHWKMVCHIDDTMKYSLRRTAIEPNPARGGSGILGWSKVQAIPDAAPIPGKEYRIWEGEWGYETLGAQALTKFRYQLLVSVRKAEPIEQGDIVFAPPTRWPVAVPH